MLPIESCDYITVCFLILMGQLSVFGHVSPNKAQISTDEIVNNTTICFPKTNPLNVFSDGKLRRNMRSFLSEFLPSVTTWFIRILKCYK